MREEAWHQVLTLLFPIEYKGRPFKSTADIISLLNFSNYFWTLQKVLSRCSRPIE